MPTYEKHMRLSDEEKRRVDELRKPKVTPKNSFYTKPGSGRPNERYEKAANRRAADIYVQNH